MGNSLVCSPSGERLVSAARDGDLAEAQALLDLNPSLAKYSTFGVRNTPLHFAAAQGHDEIVVLLLESGVDINIRNYGGQTALMQACRYGHWEVVQTLILYRTNIKRGDYLNGCTALHFAAINGHVRCIRLLFADYVPNVPYFWDHWPISTSEEDGWSMKTYPDKNSLSKIVNWPADGGITALHMAALNGHAECVHLLLDLTADVSAVTIQDGTSICFTGAGSTPLHFAACGGNTTCCQVLISRGASRITKNENGWTALDVARIWKRYWLEALLMPDTDMQVPPFPPSCYLVLPLMSIVKIARDRGWRKIEYSIGDVETCAVCLEQKCIVAAEGCGHEFCTKCALYLCSTSSTVSGSPGAIPCPLCRHAIISFVALGHKNEVKELAKPSNRSLTLCTAYPTEVTEPLSISSSSEYRSSRISLVSSSDANRPVICHNSCVKNLQFSLCKGNSHTGSSIAICHTGRLSRA